MAYVIVCLPAQHKNHCTLVTFPYKICNSWQMSVECRQCQSVIYSYSWISRSINPRLYIVIGNQVGNHPLCKVIHFMHRLSITDVMFGCCRLVFLGSYNRTTNWRNSGNEPQVARVIVSSQSSLHIPAQCLIAFFALLVMSFVSGPRTLHLCHIWHHVV